MATNPDLVMKGGGVVRQGYELIVAKKFEGFWTNQGIKINIRTDFQDRTYEKVTLSTNTSTIIVHVQVLSHP